MDNAREVVAMIRSDYPEPLWIQAATLIHDQINGGVLKAGAGCPRSASCASSSASAGSRCARRSTSWSAPGC